jgi:hypothetical protein
MEVLLMGAGEKQKQSELESLLVENEEGDVDKVLRMTLEGRIAIERSSGLIVSRPGLFKLSQAQRLIVLLLARHASYRLGIPNISLEASAEDLASGAQVPVKNCRELLSRLKASGLISKGTAGYTIPKWNLLQATRDLPQQ